MALPQQLSMLLPKDAPWTPTYYTKPLPNSKNEGWKIALFASVFLTAIRGERQNLPIDLTQWQTWLTNNIFETKEDGDLRYKEVLLMIPRKNGKTFLASIYLLYHLVTAPRGAEIYSAAGSQAQARLIFENVRDWINNSPELSAMLEVKDSLNKVVNKKTKAFYKALSSDAGKAHGLAPYFTVCDELAKWDGHSAASKRAAMELLNALQKGSIDRRGSQLLMISTAGDFIDEQLLGGIYKRGIAQYKAEESNDAKGAFGFFCWEAAESDNPLDPETWKKANPNIAEGIIPIENIEDNLASSTTTSIATFLRDHLNIWSSVSGDPFIQPYIWEGATYNSDTNGYDEPFYKGCPVVVGFDASKRGDSTAIVIQTLGDDESPGGVLKIWEIWERPENPPEGWYISRSDVEASMKRLHEEYDVKAIWADKFYYEAALVEWQEKYEWEIELVPQTAERKDRYANEFRADLLEGAVTHLNEEVLNRHIKNTVLNNRESFSKPAGSSSQKIDAFVASMLANAGRNFILNEPEEEEVQILRFG